MHVFSCAYHASHVGMFSRKRLRHSLRLLKVDGVPIHLDCSSLLHACDSQAQKLLPTLKAIKRQSLKARQLCSIYARLRHVLDAHMLHDQAVFVCVVVRTCMHLCATQDKRVCPKLLQVDTARNRKGT